MAAKHLPSLISQFQYYMQLGEKTFSQLTDENLFHQFNEDSNSVATIVKHLHGNMMSRWTDFFTTDGEKEWRKRDGEFENDINTREGMLKLWNEGWACLFRVLNDLSEDDLQKEIFIRNQGHTVADAIFRQLAHYSYHVGQIVYVGKMISTSPWASLSIPKGETAAYNAEKFAQPKQTKHFTDEFLKGEE
ncbi:MAG: DUF1572 family protein [Bacteroidota bacterium]